MNAGCEDGLSGGKLVDCNQEARLVGSTACDEVEGEPVALLLSSASGKLPNTPAVTSDEGTVLEGCASDDDTPDDPTLGKVWKGICDGRGSDAVEDLSIALPLVLLLGAPDVMALTAALLLWLCGSEYGRGYGWICCVGEGERGGDGCGDARCSPCVVCFEDMLVQPPSSSKTASKCSGRCFTSAGGFLVSRLLSWSETSWPIGAEK